MAHRTQRNSLLTIAYFNKRILQRLQMNILMQEMHRAEYREGFKVLYRAKFQSGSPTLSIKAHPCISLQNPVSVRILLNQFSKNSHFLVSHQTSHFCHLPWSAWLPSARIPVQSFSARLPQTCLLVVISIWCPTQTYCLVINLYLFWLYLELILALFCNLSVPTVIFLNVLLFVKINLLGIVITILC